MQVAKGEKQPIVLSSFNVYKTQRWPEITRYPERYISGMNVLKTTKQPCSGTKSPLNREEFIPGTINLCLLG